MLARKHVTQVGILKRAADTLIVIMTVAAAMMSFEQVRQYGVSLFASAGVAGLAIGIAARPLLANLIAGVQIAVAQPIRLDDVVFLEGEYGTIEEITTTYVVIKLWDWRRMVVPLSYFIEKPFQNWTRETSALIGSVFLYVDYTVPVEKLREKLMEVARASPLWDGRVVVLQVSDATKDHTVELRALLSARSAPAAWDLRCEVREKLIAYLQEEYPGALPRQRQEFVSRSDRIKHSVASRRWYRITVQAKLQHHLVAIHSCCVGLARGNVNFKLWKARNISCLLPFFCEVHPGVRTHDQSQSNRRCRTSGSRTCPHCYNRRCAAGRTWRRAWRIFARRWWWRRRHGAAQLQRRTAHRKLRRTLSHCRRGCREHLRAARLSPDVPSRSLEAAGNGMVTEVTGADGIGAATVTASQAV